MNKTLTYALKFGSVTGAIMIVSWFVTHQLFASDDGGFEYGVSEILGYAAMILAFTAVFVGVKNFRDKEMQGSITFGKAFLIGLYIVLVTSAIYVIGWMIYYPNFMADFPEQYMASQIKILEENGMTGAELEDKRMELASFMEWYKQPLNMMGMTFMEIFPVGLIVAVISAVIWKKK